MPDPPWHLQLVSSNLWLLARKTYRPERKVVKTAGAPVPAFGCIRALATSPVVRPIGLAGTPWPPLGKLPILGLAS
eukprot:3003576-Amphidinium_carterae.1